MSQWLARTTNLLRTPDRFTPMGIKASQRPRQRSLASIFPRTDDNRCYKVRKEVRDALDFNKPVVALETAIYTHGFPYPDNLSLAHKLESIVRQNGAVPATVGILDGIARVGLSGEDLVRLAEAARESHTMKVSRRDLPHILGMGIAGRTAIGGTTISGTMCLARQAGISVLGTGGLGGVHRGGQDTMDISADLTELGRTPMAIISSGCKSFLDIPRTLEFLETQGVGVYTFVDGRTGDIDFPAFFTRDSGVRSPMVVRDAGEAAAIIYASMFLQSPSGIHFANPIPERYSIPKSEIAVAVNEAVDAAAAQGYSGHTNTPFILEKIRALTEGRSITANAALVESNVAVAAQVAVEFARLSAEEGHPSVSPRPNYRSDSGDERHKTLCGSTHYSGASTRLHTKKDFEVLVFGSVAIDHSCDYIMDQEAPLAMHSDQTRTPRLDTSNRADIGVSVGGVGHNVALAIHRIGGGLPATSLSTLLARDFAGTYILSYLEQCGMDSQNVRTVGRHNEFRTAQYVAINDCDKNLFTAMADMSIFSGHRPFVPRASTQTQWVVIDANWSEHSIQFLLHRCRELFPNAKIAYEPVSNAKAGKVLRHSPTSTFAASHGSANKPVMTGHSDESHDDGLGNDCTSQDSEKKQDDIVANQQSQHTPEDVIRDPLIDLATPNKGELLALHKCAKNLGHFDLPLYHETMKNIGLTETAARDIFSASWSFNIMNPCIPLCAMQLLPYIPAIVTTLGNAGVFVAELLRSNDIRLKTPEYEAHIFARNDDSHDVGGIYMRHFPALNTRVHTKVSVNGTGDTFLGVIVAGLAKGCILDEPLINLAQEAACLTLESDHSVSPRLPELKLKLYDTILSDLQKRFEESMVQMGATWDVLNKGKAAVDDLTRSGF